MITGNMLRDMIISAANNIKNQKEEINKLNVFPVPDGDTGTNMSLTINACVVEIMQLEDAECTVVADKISNCMLRGARGNSGVILSLLFRGFAKGLKGLREADGENVANAFMLGVEAAYKAVMKPTEGTILTVARIASEACVLKAMDTKVPLEIFEEYLTVAKDTLEKTPDMLPALKQANVVDAGGRGLIVIIEGMFSVLCGGEIIPPEETHEKLKPSDYADFSMFDTGDIKFTYCTEFIVVKTEKSNKDVLLLRQYLESMGDSVVAVDDDEIIKVHVHTNHPGKAIEKALKFGYLIKLKIDNMKEQHSSKSAVSENEKGNNKTDKYEYTEPVNDYGIAVVAAGEGLRSVFTDMGADVVIDGGQTMNPSTQDILEAVKSIGAKNIFVMPNNKNIIMAAEQASEICDDRNIIVVPTKTIPQGINALMMFDPTGCIDTNINDMNDAVAVTKTAHITFAARDSVFDGHEIKQGQYLGLIENKVSFVLDDINSIMKDIIDNIYDSESTSSINLYYGQDVDDDEAARMSGYVSSLVPNDVDVTMLSGGQNVYYYIISCD